MERQVAVITGASGGIGREAVRMMAAKGYDIIMACRNLEKAGRVREGILAEQPSARLEIRQVELSSFESIRSFADGLRKDGVGVMKLFNCAGVMNRHFCKTESGLELTLAVNLVAPYLMIKSLEPVLVPGAHIVNMVSLSRYAGVLRKDLFEALPHRFGQIKSYADSKVALYVYSAWLAAHEPRYKINVADPGIVDTDMIRMHRWFDPLTDIFFRPICNKARKGAIPAVNAMCSEVSGQFYVGRKKKRPMHKKYTGHSLAGWLIKELEKVAG